MQPTVTYSLISTAERSAETGYPRDSGGQSCFRALSTPECPTPQDCTVDLRSKLIWSLLVILVNFSLSPNTNHVLFFLCLCHWTDLRNIDQRKVQGGMHACKHWNHNQILHTVIIFSSISELPDLQLLQSDTWQTPFLPRYGHSTRPNVFTRLLCSESCASATSEG